LSRARPWVLDGTRQPGWGTTYLACRVECRDPHGVSYAVPVAPHALSAAVPRGGYVFPDASEHVLCVSPDAARSRSSERRWPAQQLFGPRMAIHSALSEQWGLKRRAPKSRAGFAERSLGSMSSSHFPEAIQGPRWTFEACIDLVRTATTNGPCACHLPWPVPGPQTWVCFLSRQSSDGLGQAVNGSRRSLRIAEEAARIIQSQANQNVSDLRAAE
jgi:hypothetical protein